jgi:hypothetical protein
MTIRHLALFEYSSSASAAEVDAALEGLRELPSRIPTIRDFSLTEDLGKRPGSFRYCLICYFDTLEQMRAYLDHPAHVAAVKRVAPILEKLAEHDHEV